jgi:aminoglycoside phosphotransferase (APT) family kinase protein
VLQDRLDVGPALKVWEAALAESATPGQPVWMQGDLLSANLLIENHELTAVVDFGLLGVGDPACDLMVAWTYLSADSPDAFRAALAVDDATWCRGRGWALQFGLRAAAYSADDPLLDDIGRKRSPRYWPTWSIPAANDSAPRIVSLGM